MPKKVQPSRKELRIRMGGTLTKRQKCELAQYEVHRAKPITLPQMKPRNPVVIDMWSHFKAKQIRNKKKDWRPPYGET